MKSHWRERAAPVVAAVLRETRGEDEKTIRRALQAAYPFGERRMWPYRAWLAEVNAQWPEGRRRRAMILGRERGGLFDE